MAIDLLQEERSWDLPEVFGPLVTVLFKPPSSRTVLKAGKLYKEGIE